MSHEGCVLTKLQHSPLPKRTLLLRRHYRRHIHLRAQFCFRCTLHIRKRSQCNVRPCARRTSIRTLPFCSYHVVIVNGKQSLRDHKRFLASTDSAIHQWFSHAAVMRFWRALGSVCVASLPLGHSPHAIRLRSMSFWSILQKIAQKKAEISRVRSVRRDDCFIAHAQA